MCPENAGRWNLAKNHCTSGLWWWLSVWVGDITLGITIDGLAVNVDAIVVVYGLFDIHICWASLH